ncbi:beta-alanyl-dopamine/carcinine hydrolase-like [Saccoglossus kowalevskii]|uniref:Uncharacterized protein LOC100368512 n=1 Tax=Saccoglossus kowalevskii TaxID=10224 RepID=A0ABM0GJR1_SACKO|nr:PREDICTED: uncharacterized protein LOC100368512 [Saccoglossus kowalevskii]
MIVSIMNILIILTLCVWQAWSLSIPLIITKGTHYEVGHDVGASFKDRIQNFCNEFSILNDVLIPYYHMRKGRKAYDDLLNVANATFPQIVDEIQGLADGAELPFYKVFLLHIKSEIQLLLRKQFDPECTDIALNYVDQKTQRQWTIQAHNEDTDPIIGKYAYITDAYIIDPTGKYPTERFTAYTYPGSVPGNAFAFNADGMLFTMNAVFPKKVETDNIARYIANRMLLGCRSVSDVFSFLDKYGSASGFSLNFVDATTPLADQMLYNVEVGPGMKQYSNATVPLANNKADGHCYHFNMYKHFNISQFNDTSTQHRSARAAKLAVPADLTGIYNILGDTADPDYPIFRNGKKKDGAATVSTAIFDLVNGTLSIYLDNPKMSQGPVIVLQLPKKKIWN